jgi:hypothetical protein
VGKVCSCICSCSASCPPPPPPPYPSISPTYLDLSCNTYPSPISFTHSFLPRAYQFLEIPFDRTDCHSRKLQHLPFVHCQLDIHSYYSPGPGWRRDPRSLAHLPLRLTRERERERELRHNREVSPNTGQHVSLRSQAYNSKKQADQRQRSPFTLYRLPSFNPSSKACRIPGAHVPACLRKSPLIPSSTTRYIHRVSTSIHFPPLHDPLPRRPSYPDPVRHNTHGPCTFAIISRGLGSGTVCQRPLGLTHLLTYSLTDYLPFLSHLPRALCSLPLPTPISSSCSNSDSSQGKLLHFPLPTLTLTPALIALIAIIISLHACKQAHLPLLTVFSLRPRPQGIPSTFSPGFTLPRHFA